MKIFKSVSILEIVFGLLIFSGCENDRDPEVEDFTLTITSENGQVIVIKDGDTLQQATSFIFTEGTEISLSAIPESDYEFTEWSGSVSSTENPLTLQMDENKNVTAVFGEDQDPPYEAGDTKDFYYNGTKITMIYCPGGTFLTNDDDSDTDYEDGSEVTCEPFWISETEVTNEMAVDIYSAMNGTEVNPDGGGIVGGTGIFNNENKKAHNYVEEAVVKWGEEPLMYMKEILGERIDIYYNGTFNVYDNRYDQPVKEITWYGCIMYCNWLTKKVLGSSHEVYSGIDTTWIDDETVADFTKDGFRLPTNIEWECAARWQGNDASGDAYEWPVGSGNFWTQGSHASGCYVPTSDLETTASFAVFRYNDSFKENPTETSVVKGDRLSNFLGVYDMNGNVEEWLWDEKENSIARYLRGGGFVSQHYYVRIGEPAYGGMPASGSGSDLGFRLAMSAE